MIHSFSLWCWTMLPRMLATSITTSLSSLKREQAVACECHAYIIQWTPSNPATLRTSQSVLIGGVTSFQGYGLEGVHCNILCQAAKPSIYHCVLCSTSPTEGPSKAPSDQSTPTSGGGGGGGARTGSNGKAIGIIVAITIISLVVVSLLLVAVFYKKERRYVYTYVYVRRLQTIPPSLNGLSLPPSLSPLSCISPIPLPPLLPSPLSPFSPPLPPTPLSAGREFVKHLCT